MHRKSGSDSKLPRVTSAPSLRLLTYTQEIQPRHYGPSRSDRSALPGGSRSESATTQHVNISPGSIVLPPSESKSDIRGDTIGSPLLSGAARRQRDKICDEFVYLREKCSQYLSALTWLPPYSLEDHKPREIWQSSESSGATWVAYFGKAFQTTARLWKIQQEHRAILESAKLISRVEVGEMASKIGHLYYQFYQRTSDTSCLNMSFTFYEAIRLRHYFREIPRITPSGQARLWMLRQLRYYSRFIVVCLLLNRRSLLSQVHEELSQLVNAYLAVMRKATSFLPQDAMEWQSVVQEIHHLLQGDRVLPLTSSPASVISSSQNLSAGSSTHSSPVVGPIAESPVNRLSPFELLNSNEGTTTATAAIDEEETVNSNTTTSSDMPQVPQTFTSRLPPAAKLAASLTSTAVRSSGVAMLRDASPLCSALEAIDTSQSASSSSSSVVGGEREGTQQPQTSSGNPASGLDPTQTGPSVGASSSLHRHSHNLEAWVMSGRINLHSWKSPVPAAHSSGWRLAEAVITANPRPEQLKFDELSLDALRILQVLEAEVSEACKKVPAPSQSISSSLATSTVVSSSTSTSTSSSVLSATTATSSSITDTATTGLSGGGVGSSSLSSLRVAAASPAVALMEPLVLDSSAGTTTRTTTAAVSNESTHSPAGPSSSAASGSHANADTSSTSHSGEASDRRPNHTAMSILGDHTIDPTATTPITATSTTAATAPSVAPATVTTSSTSNLTPRTLGIPCAPLQKSSLHASALTTSSTPPANPHKHLLFRPSMAQLMLAISAAQQNLPAQGVLMLYFSASSVATLLPAGTSSVPIPASAPSPSGAPPSPFSEEARPSLSQALLLSTIPTPPSPTFSPSPSQSVRQLPPHVLRNPQDMTGATAQRELTAQVLRASLLASDLLPFTRKPLLLVVESDMSESFAQLPAQSQFGMPIVCLMSPARALELSSPQLQGLQGLSLSGSEPGQHSTTGISSSSSTNALRVALSLQQRNTSLFTFFLHSPLRAFCHITGVRALSEQLFHECQEYLDRTFTEYIKTMVYRPTASSSSADNSPSISPRPVGTPSPVISGLSGVHPFLLAFFASSCPFLSHLLCRFLFCRTVFWLLSSRSDVMAAVAGEPISSSASFLPSIAPAIEPTVWANPVFTRSVLGLASLVGVRNLFP